MGKAFVLERKITDGKKFTIFQELDAGELGKLHVNSIFTFHQHINPFYCKTWANFWYFCDLLLINPLCSPVYAGPLPAALALGALL